MNDGWLASLPMLLPFIQKSLNLDFGKIGVLTSILGVSGVFLAIPAATIASKLGGFRVLIIAAVFYSCSFLILAFSPGFLVLAGAFILASIGFGIFHPVSFSLVARISKPNELGRKMGSFTAIGDIGRIAIAACVTLLVSFSGWRSAAFIYGLVPLLLILAFIAIARKNVIWTASGSANETVHGLHRNARYLFALASSCIDAFASSTLFVFIPFLYIHRGASAALLGSLSGAFFIGNMLGKYFSGKIVDKLGSSRVFVFSEIIMAVLLMGLSGTKSILLIAGISVLLGAVTKGTVPVINTIIANSVDDKRLFDKAFGVGSLVNGIASVLAPLLFGLIIDRYGIVTVFKISACFAIIAVIPLLLSGINDKRKAKMA